MRAFNFQKLVRDKIAAVIEKNGGKVVSRKLKKDEFIVELVKKVAEEAREIKPSLSKPEATEELADVVEAIAALKKEFGIADRELEKFRREKLRTRGGFDKRIFIDHVEVPDDYPWLNHYLKNKNRYSEIVKQR